MAEAAIQFLLENLTSLIGREIGLVIGVDKQMRKLSKTLTTIQKVLEDAEDQQFQSQQVQIWLRELNAMAFEIEDLVDEYNTEVSKVKHTCGSFSLKKLLLKHKIGRRMKDAVQRLDSIAEDRNKFHFQESVDQPSNQFDWRRATGSIVYEPDHVYGRDDDRDKIVDMLVSHVCDQKLSVLPILGIGGLGKTTLAQLIYNHDRVTRHFNTKLWICVSDHYDLLALLKAAIESATGEKSIVESLDSLQLRLREKLKEKRYLLILDDLWNENPEDWATLKGILDCGSLGASIIVTTRLKTVSEIMGTLPAHCLTGLSEEQCWVLLRLRAFGSRDEQCHPNLETIGRRIVKKCGGVPLAAKALGGVLRTKRSENEWIRVEKSDVWNLPEENNSIMPVLRLSYRHLPFELKRCFAFCAVYPKDYKFEKTELIFHWMAHGCIRSEGTRSEVEDVGDQIWNELALRSFFQQVTSIGSKTTFKMHDLIHDLAQSIMENKIPGAETRGNASNSRIRHIHYNGYRRDNICSSIAIEVSTPTAIVNYSRLRFLKLSWLTDMKELPSAIGKLKHLRCLSLRNCRSLRTLPRTFCCLYNLQILILDYCDKLESLPKNIRCMTNLRHILIDGCSSMKETPRRIGELSSLKSLSFFVVGDKEGNELDELEHLDLGGRLEIKHLERVQNHMKANLVGKPYLRSLTLEWDEGGGTLRDDDKVVEALEPHINLTSLEIYGFEGLRLCVWMKGMTNLTEISLKKCRNCRHLPPLGDLPVLRELFLKNLEALEYVFEDENWETAKFPSLEVLLLEGLDSLKGLVNEEQVGVGEVVFPKLTSVVCVSMIPPSFSSGLKLPNVSSLKLNLWGMTEEWRGWNNIALDGLCNLKDLEIWNANTQRWLERWFGGLNSLRELELWQCSIGSSLGEGWLEHLTALESLWIYNCSEVGNLGETKHLHLLKIVTFLDVEDMVSLPQALQHIPSLQSLVLYYLPEVGSLPDWLPRSLTSLEINDCPAIQCLPSTMQSLTNLQSLELYKLPELRSLPDWLPRSLTSLTIWDCPAIQCLPSTMQSLTNLQSLVLYDLPEVGSLPDWLPCSLSSLEIIDCPAIQCLPSTMQSLTNLQSLKIMYCPQLSRRCEKPNGDDCHLIAHIPHLDTRHYIY